MTDFMNVFLEPGDLAIAEYIALPAFHPPIAMSVLRFLDLDFNALNRLYLINYIETDMGADSISGPALTVHTLKNMKVKTNLTYNIDR